MTSAPTHIPVLLKETIEALAVQPGGRYIDCTLGAGGHTVAILDRSSPGGQLLGIDADPEAIKIARARLEAYSSSILLVNENFVDLEAICIKYDFLPVHGILFDLGLSSLQLNSRGRGFSFQHDAPLDMRLNPSQEITAADIINTSSEAELAHLLKTYGEEGYSHQITHRIVQERPIKTTLQLVNHEFENLEAALKRAINLLGFDGRLVVISYHSLEDRIVKQLMQRESKDCICPPSVPTCVCGHRACLRLINKRVITPSPAEVQLNPRSRSAKLRVAERIITHDEYYRTTEEYRFSAQVNGGWRRPALLEKLRVTFSAL